MGVFARHVDAVLTGLSWKRTIVIEQGRWEARRTSWKPHGDHVRNLRTVRGAEPEIVGSTRSDRVGPNTGLGQAHEVMAKTTYFEYEEYEWRKYRTFSVKGDSASGTDRDSASGTASDTPAVGVRWPEHALEPEQRISERSAAYHARFTAGPDHDEYVAELDEETWRTLRVGHRYRLKLGPLSDEVKQVIRLPG
jgi:hypothetical protein